MVHVVSDLKSVSSDHEVLGHRSHVGVRFMHFYFKAVAAVWLLLSEKIPN